MHFSEEYQIIQMLPYKMYKVGNNFRLKCPICNEGDSKSKTRGFFILKKGSYSFYCHNCQRGWSLWNFLKDNDSRVFEYYKQVNKKYYLEEIKKSNGVYSKKTNIDFADEMPVLKTVPLLPEFIPVEKSDQLQQYLYNRKIPFEKWDTFYYLDNDILFREKLLYLKNSLVVPFKRKEVMYGWQARRLQDKLFFNAIYTEGFKVFNWFNVDHKKPVYIFESIIDSLFVENSIACIGADIPIYFLNALKKPIFVFDNDETGYRKSLKYFGKYKVFVYPKWFTQKDLNEYIIDGGDSSIIFNKENSFKDLITLKMKMKNLNI